MLRSQRFEKKNENLRSSRRRGFQGSDRKVKLVMVGETFGSALKTLRLKTRPIILSLCRPLLARSKKNLRLIKLNYLIRF